jgi:hypothetical protein
MGRNNEDFLTGSYKIDNGDNTTYFTGLGENSIGTGSGAVVKVNHPYDEWENNPSATDQYGYRADDWDMRNWAEHNTDKKGNVALFNGYHKPPVFHLAMGTKDASYQSGTLGLHAVADIERRFGERPWASDNTSSFSTPAVNDAIEKGIIPGVIGQKPGEPARAGNTYGFPDAHGQVQTGHRIVKRAKMREEAGITGEGFEEIDPDLIGQDARALTREGIAYKKETKRIAKAKEEKNALPPDAPLSNLVAAIKNTRRRGTLAGGKPSKYRRTSSLSEGINDGKGDLSQLELPGF